MNQKEYKTLLHGPKENRPKDFFKFRNITQKLLGYKRGKGLVIHHLRDTEEQQQFNDLYYERWGIDFDGKLKYCILLTIEEHKKLHEISQETRNKIAKSVSISKTKLTEEERIKNKITADKRYKQTHKEEIKQYKKEYYLKNKETIKKHAKTNKNKEYNKQWKIKNHEKVLEAKRKAYYKKANSNKIPENN